MAFDSAEQAYNRAVEVDSTFALAHFRRALTYGWTGGYGSSASLEASAAGTRFAPRLQPRERRLLAGYRLIDVESLDRAIEIAAKASAAPAFGGICSARPSSTPASTPAPPPTPSVRPSTASYGATRGWCRP